eukprot:6472312-Ditylum_brightwellii.AAC.1
MPPLLTYAARVSDGLPLVASMTASSEIGDDHKSQAKELLRGLGGRTTTAKMSISTSSNKVFFYVIRDNI